MKSKFSMSKSYPYAFSVRQAVETMQLLKLAIDLEFVTSNISYSVSQDLAFALLNMYFDAHLLHCPKSRTEKNLSEDMTIQLSPKGTALVYNFCKRTGMRPEQMPAVVKSSFNSLRLFSFERSPITNKVLYSEYLLLILTTLMMGPSPNVWSPALAPMKIRNLFEEESCNCSLFSVLLVSRNPFEDQDPMVKPELYVSPLHHKYFTNPESEAHIQYYESETGIRLHTDRGLGNEKQAADYSFTGKSMVQWLMDCTKLLSVSEALEVCNLLLKHGYLAPVSVQASRRSFSPQRNAYYTLSKIGKQACQWENGNDLEASSLEYLLSHSSELYFKKVSLKAILSDPGMKFLFKLHMAKERCSENLDAYLLLVEFAKLKGHLSRLMELNSRLEDDQKKRRLASILENQVNSCYSMAFHLYLTYLSLDSLYDLNIDYGLRQEVNRVMKYARGTDGTSSPMYYERPLTDFMKTPIYDKLQEEMLESLHNGTLEHSSQTNGSLDTEIQSLDSDRTQSMREDSDKMLVEELMAAMGKIYEVFGKIANSIYRLMEVDSYPKFMRSEEYLHAIGIETHRS